MPHAWWHIIECGGVGRLLGYINGLSWVHYGKFIAAYRLGSGIDDRIRRRLHKRIDRTLRRMASIAGEFITGTAYHDLMLDGDFCGVAVGQAGEVADLPPMFDYEYLSFTYVVIDDTLSEEDAAALRTLLNIERGRIYVDVWEETGGLISEYAEKEDE